ncbi:murein hydrolase activator EnvC family protein [Saccharospirillum mangrovi]|uniref:murein hydrolase activator EnvC family protein n=1 Tax=Saccharospirillum mangrovi TaxID=2161747 RepID=UPI00130027E1|nr:peptidoglycan DD-metalloendopeptidase family protein [Saccharospirillum mangrovi]
MFGLSLAALACASVGAEDDLTLRERELQQLQNQIQSLEAELRSRRGAVSEQRQALETTERQLGDSNRRLRDTEARLAQARTQLDRLTAEQTELEARQEEQRETIRAILRLAYKQNNQPLIKLLLSGQRPEELARQMHYFAILNDDQNAALQAWVERSERLAANIVEQQQLTDQLQSDRQQIASTRDQLAQQKNRRSQILANLSAEAEAAEAELARKEAEQAQLNELIERMRSELADLDFDFPDGTDMAEAKGRLPWPVDGTLRARFGRPIEGSRLNWQGWLIGANAGTQVHAIHHGRVVFADWLNGFGLLIIVDHGNGLMSLYGRNQALLRDVGAWVGAGDVIAEVGLSGGFTEPALYFELRRNGRPENPDDWLQNR